MKLLTAKQMQDVDRRTIVEMAIPGVILMENAGRGVANIIVERYTDRLQDGVVILAGKGNNGGDGYVIARCLLDRGWPVDVLVLADREAIQGDAAIHLHALEKCGGRVCYCHDEAALLAALGPHVSPGLAVDALFGTGLVKPVKGHYATAVAWLNRQPAPVVAVDIPSGIDASTGRVLDLCVDADLTVTFAYPKIGQVSYPGAAHIGKLMTVDIGIPAGVKLTVSSEVVFVDALTAAAMLPLRPADGHKGTFGHLLVLAGSIGKTGAAVMTADAGLRGGAGLVTLACPDSVQPVVATKLTEVMTAPVTDVKGEVSLQALDDVLALAQEKQALAVGPGLGTGEESGALVRRILQDADLPAVVDADALTALMGHLDVLSRRSQPTILTPHPGEMARLTGLSVAQIQADRFSVARDFALKYNAILVLKGARTVTACPDGSVYINASGHAGLGSGGMGDVLTGLIASLLAQGVPAGEAAALGVFLHGHAADRLSTRFGDAGLLATDVLMELPAARRSLTKEI